MATERGRAPGLISGAAPITARPEMLRKVLLACGVLSSLLYVVANDVLGALRYEGYSRVAQAVSELTSPGAPSRAVLVPWFAFAYSALVIAFGVGVWQSAQGRRGLVVTGGLLVVYGATGPLWLPFPMTARADIAPTAPMAFTDVVHIVLTAVTVLLMLAAIGFAAAALGPRFRRYSLVTAATVVAFGAWTGMYAAGSSRESPLRGSGWSNASASAPSCCGWRCWRWPCGAGRSRYLLATRREARSTGWRRTSAGRCGSPSSSAAPPWSVPTWWRLLDHADGVLTFGLELHRDIAATLRRHCPDTALTIDHRLRRLVAVSRCARRRGPPPRTPPG